MNAASSSLGVFHTAVSVLAIGAGFVAIFRDGKIDPKNRAGKTYLAAMLIATLTAFGIVPHGFRIGHVLSLVTLAVLLSGIFASSAKWLGRAARYIETLSFSTSFLLLMVFATTETLTRLPVSHPIAASQEAPLLGVVRLGLLVAFLLGSVYQVLQLRATKGHQERNLCAECVEPFWR